MAAREDLPRISVDTVEDWQRLVSNCRYAASDILGKEIRSRGLSSEREALQQHMQAVRDVSVVQAHALTQHSVHLQDVHCCPAQS